MRIKINETKKHEPSADWILCWLLSWRVSPRPAVGPHLWWDMLLDAVTWCQRPWVHGTDAIITQVQLTDSSHMTLWMIVVHQKELGVPCAYLPSDCGSEDLMLMPNNSQGTSGCQMKVSVQPSKHTPPPNFPNPLINRSCWRRQQAAESSLFKLCCLLEELHQICRHWGLCNNAK